MEQKELNKILENHKHWLFEDCKRWQAMKANLHGVNLSYADLRYTNLSGANLSCANLHEANLHGVNLSYADLSGANLSDANLSDANLRYTNLSGANLSDANLSGTSLSCANLHEANLNCANLSYANLSHANLHCVNLSHASLHCVNLSCANLSGAKNLPFIPIACPEKGLFIGFKKIENYIVELEIPSNSRRSSATTRKCRCEFAKVLSITDSNGKEIQSITNHSFGETVYEVGKMVYPDSFDENRWNECSHGIHFFINKQEAINY